MSDPELMAVSKTPHQRGCDGQLYRLNAVAHVDRTGRLDNGGIVVHDYRCDMGWHGCNARVLVTERAVRMLAVAVEERPYAPDQGG